MRFVFVAIVLGGIAVARLASASDGGGVDNDCQLREHPVGGAGLKCTDAFAFVMVIEKTGTSEEALVESQQAGLETAFGDAKTSRETLKIAGAEASVRRLDFGKPSPAAVGWIASFPFGNEVRVLVCGTVPGAAAPRQRCESLLTRLRHLKVAPMAAPAEVPLPAVPKLRGRALTIPADCDFTRLGGIDCPDALLSIARSTGPNVTLEKMRRSIEESLRRQGRVTFSRFEACRVGGGETRCLRVQVEPVNGPPFEVLSAQVKDDGATVDLKCIGPRLRPPLPRPCDQVFDLAAPPDGGSAADGG